MFDILNPLKLLQQAKTKLEFEIQSLQQKLQLASERHQMEADRKAHEYTLKTNELIAKFEREKKFWQEDKEKFLASQEDRYADRVAKLESDFELKKLEAVKLNEISRAQEIAKKEIAYEKHLLELKTAHQQEVSELRIKHKEEISIQQDKLLKESYDRVQDLFAKTNLEGTHQMNAFKEVVLSVFSRGHEFNTNRFEVLTGAVAPKAN